MSGVYEKLAQVLVTHLGLEPTLVRPEATFAELAIDSLSMIELAQVLQEDYGIDVEGIDPTATLAQAVAQVEEAVTTAPPGEATGFTETRL